MRNIPRSALLLIAIWALILVFPPLRLVWQVQMTGSPFMRFSASPTKPEPPNFWQIAAQQYPDDINILAQAAEERSISKIPAEEEYDEDDEPIYTSDDKPLPSPIFPGKPRGDFEFEKLRRYDQLIKKYPNNVWLLARRLQLTIGYFHPDRVGGEFSDGNGYENARLGKPSPERGKDKPNFTNADLNRAIDLCKHGQELEPDNPFFDWLLCNFLSLGWRNSEAWQALDGAARKTLWDAHLTENWQAIITAQETVYGRPLLWEEKLQLFSATLFPQYARYREQARTIAWEGLKARRRGDHAQALRLWGDLARVARRMREGSRSYIEGLVAIALEAIAVGSARYDPRYHVDDTLRQGRTSPSQRVQIFQNYAAKHGRRDLALEVVPSQKAANAYRALVSSRVGGGQIFGIRYWLIALIEVLWVACIFLLLMLPLTLVAWILLSALIRIRRVRSVLQFDTRDEPLSQSEVLGGALACGGLRALGSALLGALILGSCVASGMMATGQSKELRDSITSAWNDLTGITPGSIDPSPFEYFLLDGAPDQPWQTRPAIALLPVLLGVLYATWRAVERQRLRNGEKEFRFRQWLLAIISGRAFSHDFDIARAANKLLDWVLYLGLVGAWLATGLGVSSDLAGWSLVAPLIVVLCGGVLLIERLWMWRVRPGKREAIRYGLRLLHSSFWGWVVLGSTLYLLTLLGSLPLRLQADASMDKLIRLGEVQANKS